MVLAHVCDGFTGEVVDRVPVADFRWSRLLSAGGDGRVTIPLDGSLSRAALRDHLTPWRRILVLERHGRVEFGGYVLGHRYVLGGSAVEVTLRDVWKLWARRGSWDRAPAVTAKWSGVVPGTLGVQAWSAVHRGRNTGGVLNLTRFPVSLISTGGGASVTRYYYGYHFEMITDTLSGLMDEGLDIYVQPRWLSGSFDWGFRCGPAWTSGVVREFTASTAVPGVVELTVGADAERVTNNATRLGEGSEVDMLGRSRQNFSSPYPVLDRVTSAKTVSDPAQLDQQALGDLSLYAEPTEQWDFKVRASEQIDIGDTVRINVSGDPWIPDGWHERRVVKVSGDLGEFVSIGVQPVGGA